MPIIRYKHIDKYDILESELIINPISINGNISNTINKDVKKLIGKRYSLIKYACFKQTIKTKRGRLEAFSKIGIKPITNKTYNIISFYKNQKIKYIVNIPYKKQKDNFNYFKDTFSKFVKESVTIPIVTISIPLYKDCFGKLKIKVLEEIIKSSYPAYIDIYVDNNTIKELNIPM